MAENNDSEIIIYASEDGSTRIDVRMLDETVWLTQAQMADLFGKSVKTINEHVKNIFNEGELEPSPTIRNFRIVRAEGAREVTRDIDHFLVKGFTLDDQRLKERRTADNYFEELLERIRIIRTSEINFYRRSWRYTRPARTTISLPIRLGSSSPPFRTSFTSP